MCGRCFSRQAALAHVTSVGAAIFHWERRERVLERDILRLGTATSNSFLVSAGRPGDHYPLSFAQSVRRPNEGRLHRRDRVRDLR